VVLEEIRRGEGAGGGVGAVVRTTASRAMRARSLSSEDEEKRRWGRAEGVRAKMGAELLGPAVERKDGPEGREVDWGWFGPEGKEREGKPGKVG
jgi:hypothetical protein